MFAFVRMLALGAGLIMASGCGGTEIGEPCDDVGSTDECVDGAVCSVLDGRSVCRQLCKDKEDCPDGTECTGVSKTNLHACEPTK